MKAYVIKFTDTETCEVVVWAEDERDAMNAASGIDASYMDFETESIEYDVTGEANEEDIRYLDNYGPHGEDDYEPHVCEECGKIITKGYHDGDTCVCLDCFPSYMDKYYKDWMRVDDDGCGGYYIYRSSENRSQFCGTGIYYTEWD